MQSEKFPSTRVLVRVWIWWAWRRAAPSRKRAACRPCTRAVLTLYQEWSRCLCRCRWCSCSFADTTQWWRNIMCLYLSILSLFFPFLTAIHSDFLLIQSGAYQLGDAAEQRLAERPPYWPCGDVDPGRRHVGCHHHLPLEPRRSLGAHRPGFWQLGEWMDGWVTFQNRLIGAWSLFYTPNYEANNLSFLKEYTSQYCVLLAHSAVCMILIHLNGR